MFTLAHLSDSHATSVRIPNFRDLFSKRLLGWLKWVLERRRIHRPEVLDALTADLHIMRPDHIAITGDLTNLGLMEEFAAAGVWLRQLGDTRSVSLVPGNHDAYVPEPWEVAWRHWQEYLESDASHAALLRPQASFRELAETYFPSVRIRGAVALVGVCTARPVGLFRAGGAVGEQQLWRLKKILRDLAATDLCRVVLIHHPPTHDDWTLRRGLSDGRALCEVFRKAGADLILHGHWHETNLETTPGPNGPIPIVGVRSASDRTRRPQRSAQYHLYRIEREPLVSGRPQFRIMWVVRQYDRARHRFLDGEERVLGEEA